MTAIRSMLPVLFLLLLHNNIYSQEKQSGTFASTVINYKEFPITKLVFANETSRCGYYDSANNILYDFYGQIIFKNPTTVREKILDSLCLTKDYDGDGVNDDVDKCIQERGPESNFGCPVIDNTRLGCHLNMGYAVFFANGASNLSSLSIKKLNEVIKIMKNDPELYVGLSGHTDSVGNYDFNMKLAMARAEVVKSYMLSSGITENRFKYNTANGSSRPIDDDRTKAGRARNRRVEIDMNNEEYLY